MSELNTENKIFNKGAEYISYLLRPPSPLKPRKGSVLKKVLTELLLYTLASYAYQG